MMLFMEVSREGTPSAEKNSVGKVDLVDKVDLGLYKPANYINYSFL